MHTDASDFAIGGVLIHPIAYESLKLNDTERRKASIKERRAKSQEPCTALRERDLVVELGIDRRGRAVTEERRMAPIFV